MSESVSKIIIDSPIDATRDGLVSQLGYQDADFENVYFQRNRRNAPELDGRFDKRAQAIYGGLDPKTVFFPEAQWINYPDFSKEELQAARDALNSKGTESLRRARAAYGLSNIVWLGLVSKNNMVVVPYDVENHPDLSVTQDEQGSFTRSPATDIGILGPKGDGQESFTFAMGVADCLAIPVVDGRTKAMGFAHAGRPGTGLRTSEKMVDGLFETFSSEPKDLIAWLGEGVCGECYTVDEKTLDGFIADFGGKPEIDKVIQNHPDAIKEATTESGETRYAIDLYAFNKFLLASKQVGEITVAVNCTARSSDDCVSLEGTMADQEAHQPFYSHERVKGKTVGWTTEMGQMLELNTFHLTTPRNLTAITRH